MCVYHKQVLLLAKLGEDTACALGMKECDVQTISTITGSLVDETNTLSIAECECLSYAILNLECYVMNTLATIVEELLNGALGASGLEKLKLNLTDLKESSLYLLVLNNLSLVNLKTQHITEIGEYSVDALYGNTQMLNF